LFHQFGFSHLTLLFGGHQAQSPKLIFAKHSRRLSASVLICRRQCPNSDSTKKRRLERHEATRRAQRGTCTGRRIFRSKAAREAPFMHPRLLGVTAGNRVI
jgi:hypothetical protein